LIWNVVPGSTKVLIQEHVVLGEIKFTYFTNQATSIKNNGNA